MTEQYANRVIEVDNILRGLQAQHAFDSPEWTYYSQLRCGMGREVYGAHAIVYGDGDWDCWEDRPIEYAANC